MLCRAIRLSIIAACAGVALAPSCHRPVAQPVVIAAQPADQVVSIGQTAAFAVDATGVPPLTYQWRQNGKPIPGATSAVYSRPASREDGHSTFVVAVTDGLGATVSSSAANLTIQGFTPVGSMTRPRYAHTATLLPDGKVLITGGVDDTGQWLNSAELFDPATGQFSLTGQMTAYRHYHSAVLLPTGKVLVIGDSYRAPNTYGVPPPCDETCKRSAELYDPATGTFSPTGSMAAPRDHPSVTLLRDGTVLVAGGLRFNPQTILQSTERYDPASGTFAPAASMTEPRYGHGAALLGDGTVLIVGGLQADGPDFITSEIYRPDLGTFSATGTLPLAQDQGVDYPDPVVSLADGRALIVGGGSSGLFSPFKAYASAWLFDPATRQFSLAPGSLSVARVAPFAVSLGSGQVLVAGGVVGRAIDPVQHYSYGVYTATSELYQPGSGAFTYTGNMTAARYQSASARLADGRVLLTGGFDTVPGANGYLQVVGTAQIFDPTPNP